MVYMALIRNGSYNRSRPERATWCIPNPLESEAMGVDDPRKY